MALKVLNVFDKDDSQAASALKREDGHGSLHTSSVDISFKLVFFRGSRKALIIDFWKYPFLFVILIQMFQYILLVIVHE